MSWLSRLGFVAVAVSTLGLSACLRPLYGPTPSGERLDAVLAAIEVEQVAVPVAALERLAHHLRSELVFGLNGSGLPTQKRYKLALAYTQKLALPTIDTITGRAQSATVLGEATYTLKNLDGKVVTEGVATGNASYDRSQQRFATVRAARDADIRLAKLLSEQIKTRLAVALATGT